MDRLTRRLRPDAMHPNAADCAHCSGEYMTKRGCSMRCPLRKAQLDRLAEVERLRTAEESLVVENARLRAELEAAKKKVPPFSVGDVVYAKRNPAIYAPVSMWVVSMLLCNRWGEWQMRITGKYKDGRTAQADFIFGDVGKTIFRTEQDAHTANTPAQGETDETEKEATNG